MCDKITARQKCKQLKQNISIANAVLERLLPIVEQRNADREQLARQVKTQRQEIEWYQELYDKARAGHKRAAEEAEALRRDNAQLRAELAQHKPFLQRLFG